MTTPKCQQCGKPIEGTAQQNLFGDALCYACASPMPTDPDAPEFDYYEVELIREQSAWITVKLKRGDTPRDIDRDDLREAAVDLSYTDWEEDRFSLEVGSFHKQTEEEAASYEIHDMTGDEES